MQFLETIVDLKALFLSFLPLYSLSYQGFSIVRQGNKTPVFHLGGNNLYKKCTAAQLLYALYVNMNIEHVYFYI